MFVIETTFQVLEAGSKRYRPGESTSPGCPVGRQVRIRRNCSGRLTALKRGRCGQLCPRCPAVSQAVADAGRTLTNTVAVVAYRRKPQESLVKSSFKSSNRRPRCRPAVSLNRWSRRLKHSSSPHDRFNLHSLANLPSSKSSSLSSVDIIDVRSPSSMRPSAVGILRDGQQPGGGVAGAASASAASAGSCHGRTFPSCCRSKQAAAPPVDAAVAAWDAAGLAIQLAGIECRLSSSWLGRTAPPRVEAAAASDAGYSRFGILTGSCRYACELLNLAGEHLGARVRRRFSTVAFGRRSPWLSGQPNQPASVRLCCLLVSVASEPRQASRLAFKKRPAIRPSSSDIHFDPRRLIAASAILCWLLLTTPSSTISSCFDCQSQDGLATSFPGLDAEANDSSRAFRRLHRAAGGTRGGRPTMAAVEARRLFYFSGELRPPPLLWCPSLITGSSQRAWKLCSFRLHQVMEPKLPSAQGHLANLLFPLRIALSSAASFLATAEYQLEQALGSQPEQGRASSAGSYNVKQTVERVVSPLARCESRRSAA
uniref:Protein kinase domain-containing protein n=1 Tax=Macrostomum lignano TaxID=282301 RepID=A0A1I8FKY5_9PLAT